MFGRRTAVNSPDTGLTTFTYDLAGNDAEMHLYRAARDEGATINALGATRDVCGWCQKRLPDDIPIVTPLKPLKK